MTDLLLTNSAGGDKSVFEPIDPEHIRMYVCGPTVYNLVHIGRKLLEIARQSMKHFCWNFGHNRL